MDVFKFFLCLFFCLTPFFCEADGLSYHELRAEYEIIGNKVYIQPEQLSITSKGIYIFVRNEPVLVTQVSYDEKGVYCLLEHLDTITDKCYNGHYIWCKRCWGCAVRYCKFRCICVAWE